MRVLIVEDEKQLALPLAQLLREKNYEVDCVHNGRDGFDYALLGEYDAIVLDIMLPGMNGLEVLEQLRTEGVATPIIMLTALGEDEDVVKGLNKGADDYLVKPFSAEVLAARLRAITRRKGEPMERDGALKYGNTKLDVTDLKMAADNGKSVGLSKKEALVMEVLMRNAPNVCEKQTIIVSVWGFDGQAQDNNVEVYVSFLRKKLAHIRSDCSIETVRGVGYRLESGDV